MTAHGSDPNRSARRRCGFAIRYCPVTVKPLKPSFGWNAIICRGDDRTGNWTHNPRPAGDDVAHWSTYWENKFRAAGEREIEFERRRHRCLGSLLGPGRSDGIVISRPLFRPRISTSPNGLADADRTYAHSRSRSVRWLFSFPCRFGITTPRRVLAYKGFRRSCSPGTGRTRFDSARLHPGQAARSEWAHLSRRLIADMMGRGFGFGPDRDATRGNTGTGRWR